MTDYDRFADVYYHRRKADRFNYNRDIEEPAMIKSVGDVKGKIILDIGCGFGPQMQKLAKKGAKKIIGIDLSEGLLKYAKPTDKCLFYHKDMNKRLPFKDKTFDVAYSSLAVHYAKSLNKLFKDVNRVLKKGGVFAFSTGHPVFNLIGYSKDGLVGVTKGKIKGDYFTPGTRKHDFGRDIGWVKVVHHTFEDYIKAGLGNGFELVDYVDMKPAASSKKYRSAYKLTSTLPTFIAFKFRKK